MTEQNREILDARARYAHGEIEIEEFERIAGEVADEEAKPKLTFDRWVHLDTKPVAKVIHSAQVDLHRVETDMTFLKDRLHANEMVLREQMHREKQAMQKWAVGLTVTIFGAVLSALTIVLTTPH